MYPVTLFKANFLHQAQHSFISRPRLRIDVLYAIADHVLDEQIPGSRGISFTARRQVRNVDADSTMAIALGILIMIINGIGIAPSDVLLARIVHTDLKTPAQTPFIFFLGQPCQAFLTITVRIKCLYPFIFPRSIPELPLGFNRFPTDLICDIRCYEIS